VIGKPGGQGVFGGLYQLDLPGVMEWLFCPGMLFRAAGKWWGDRGPRDRPHEGLDLLLYKDQQDRVRHVNETVRIPVMRDGVIVGIINDFIGKSVIVEHRLPDRDRGRVLTIYGHTRPLNGLHPGMAVRQGDTIATVAGPGRSAFPMAPHLHVSIAWAPEPISYDRLNWDTIGASDMLTLLDPLKLIDWRYRISGDDDPACRGL
jgi:murein DD-endopeptidase MepM/ murein hydrolase activator NlpD